MDGILIIDKPAGMTSHDVVARVRRILKTKRVGHTGTLDPFATGVMVLMIGKATRLARFLDKDVKEYVAVVQFGFETDTGDRTGSRSAECGLRDEDVSEKLSAIEWEKVFTHFRGELMQTPPMYSAKKVDGKKLYELARAGKEIERQPVKIIIHDLDLVSDELCDSDEIRDPQSAIRIRVACSAGTYIRTLAEDIGKDVGLGAHLAELRRTAAGQFGVDRSITLEALEALPVPESALLPLDAAVSHLPEFRVSENRISATKDGLASNGSGGNYTDGEYVRMIDGAGTVIAVGIYDDGEKSIRPKVVLI